MLTPLGRLGSTLIIAICMASWSVALSADDSNSPRLKLQFLGDRGHHQPARRAGELLPILQTRGIDVQYTEDIEATLEPENLANLDGLILYANIDHIDDAQATALLEFVEQGGGFIPLHCASYCFRNHEEIVALMGAQFERHGVGVFAVAPTEAAKSHPLMRGYRSFESWDETYVHTKHNERNRTVLEFRLEGDQREPWTWVRQQGQGRVFYTAWGHDGRTFTNPGFHNLIERGIRWACGDDPGQTPEFDGTLTEPLKTFAVSNPLPEAAPFDYIDVGPKIPSYVVSKQWGEQEAPKNLMQKPLSPDESIKRYALPSGFGISLFAAEPDIGGKPICMNWDERGRLWIAETFDYPNDRQPAGRGRDRIRICEDTDGDGRADKFTVFADRLSIPTSLAFSHGGVIIHQAPDTLFLIDRDGDDVADVREVLFTGWGTQDTHAGPSHLNFGPDNWFYGMVGYSGFQGIIAGQKRSFRTGFYRFKISQVDGRVAVTDFEFLRNTNNNSWGIGLSEEGLLFGSTANRNPSEFMPIANRHYERVRGWSSTVLDGIADTHEFQPITGQIRQVDHHGGYTAAAGHALYTARRYPQAFWNRAAFVAGPTGHLVGTFALTEVGAGFKSTSPLNFIASDDEWAAPIMAEVGPDGNVWVIDWYNYIVQHNPTPVGFETGSGNAYVTDLRDKRHGRIYRVTHANDAGHDSHLTTLAEATDEQLIRSLSNPNMFWRRHAQRLLVESKNTTVAPQLLDLVAREELDAIGIDGGAIHALRTLQGLGLLETPQVRSALHTALAHPSSGVVRTAIEVLPRDATSRDALLGSKVWQSDRGQVLLSALLALAEMPASIDSASQTVHTLVDHSNDRWLVDAATSAAATNGTSFLKLAGQLTPPIAEPIRRTCVIVAEHLARQGDQDPIEDLVVALPNAEPNIATAIVLGLSKGSSNANTLELSAEADRALERLFDRAPAGTQGQLIRLGRDWGSDRLATKTAQITMRLREIVADEEVESDARIDAAKQLVRLLTDEDQVVDHLLQSITPRMSQTTATGLVIALMDSRAPRVGEMILESIPSLTPAVRAEAILVLLSRPGTTSRLLSAVDSGRLAREDLTLEQWQALLAHPQRDIRDLTQQVLSKSGELPNPDREQVVASLMPLTKATGNSERGRSIFVKNCGNCHTHRGKGNKVGPDLTGMAVHPKSELLTHILDPSRSVEGNYRSYSLLTDDGVVIHGMLASESQTTVEIIDAQGKKRVVLREEIERLVASKKSVMPEGFEKQIDPQGLTDLLEFLTDKGRFLPLSINKVATAISTRSLFHSGPDGPDRFVLDDWSTIQAGQVPFHLIDPQGSRIANLILLHGPNGTLPPRMPKSVRMPCNTAAGAIHLLSGVSGWGFPAHRAQTISMIVRLHLADGTTEDHPLTNGVHFADYIRRVDVPGSEFVIAAGEQQLRHVQIRPRTDRVIKEIEFIKGSDPTAPIIMAVTVESLAK